LLQGLTELLGPQKNKLGKHCQKLLYTYKAEAHVLAVTSRQKALLQLGIYVEDLLEVFGIEKEGGISNNIAVVIRQKIKIFLIYLVLQYEF
jgi:hypothetical protein